MSDEKYPHLVILADLETPDIFETIDLLLCLGRAWVRNPQTLEKETIEDSWVPEKPIYCPKCQAPGRWPMTVTALHIVVSCGACGMHCWCNKEGT